MKLHVAPLSPRLGRRLVGPLITLTAAAGCAAAMSTPPATDTGSAITPDEAGTHAIVVSVDAIDESVGAVRIALYSAAESYAAGEPIATVATPVAGTALTASLGRFPDGDYAVMLYHDLNGNEALDRNLLGIPREPWTGSLVRSVLGSPDWDDIRFELDGADIELTLSL